MDVQEVCAVDMVAACLGAPSFASSLTNKSCVALLSYSPQSVQASILVLAYKVDKACQYAYDAHGVLIRVRQRPRWCNRGSLCIVT